MKLALISDIHANLEALQATLADIASCAVDRIVCLGDIVGYNTKPAECIALVRQAGTLCVAGNHDLAACGRISTEHFGNTAARAIDWTKRRLAQTDLDFLCCLPLKAEIAGQLIAVHGALYPQAGYATARLDNDERRMQSFRALMADRSGARICAFGHTHHAAIYELRHDRTALRAEQAVQLRDDAYYLLNPGSVGAPRSRDRRASYMIVDLDRRMATLRAVAYDDAAAFAATRRAGLAPAFAFIPAPVREPLGLTLRALRLGVPLRKLAASLGL